MKIFKYRDEIYHFLLGALLSAFTLFFLKSSSLSTSFIFMALLVSLLLLNEFEFFQAFGAIIRASLFKLCLVSYFLCMVPILLGQIGVVTFFLSLFIAAIAILGLHFYLKKKQVTKEKLKQLILIPAGIILGAFAILYLFKAIPPVPLSVQYIGVYHKVKKQSDEYQLTYTRSKWLFWQNGDQDFEASKGDKVYVFTRIFAPGNFADKIYLRWMKKNRQGDWETSDRIPLKITGGRGKGYRGYAYKSNYQPGRWKVMVETSNAQELGRISFEIIPKNNKQPIELKTDIH
ncbi:MAG: DUF2914 domain-containing protein [Halobacteriovoraceae bacterium]|mgnify:FL=1|nr:DUF2914 domain-containing protein [Halobacteriovoraceae bacterium]